MIILRIIGAFFMLWLFGWVIIFVMAGSDDGDPYRPAGPSENYEPAVDPVGGLDSPSTAGVDEVALRDGFIAQALNAGVSREGAACLYHVLRSHYPPETLQDFVDGGGEPGAFSQDADANYGAELDACPR